MKMVNNTISVSKDIINSTLINNFKKFSKLDEFLSEIPEKINRNIGNPSIIHKTSNLDNSLQNTKLNKKFHFNILRWRGFLMIPLTIVYDEYIDGSKLTGQKNIAGRIPETTRIVVHYDL